MREVLRATVSLLVVVTLVTIGVLVGILFSLPSGGLGAAPGGGHGGSPADSLAQQDGIVLVGGASGLILAMAVIWSIYHNHVLSRWLSALTLAGLAIFLSFLFRAWHYPLILEVAALLVPVLCVSFLYTEAIAAGRRRAGA